MTCRACSECDGNHHFNDDMLGDAHDEGDDETPPGSEHPAAKAGHEIWFECKHCEAWAPVVDDDDGNCVPGPAVEGAA